MPKLKYQIKRFTIDEIKKFKKGTVVFAKPIKAIHEGFEYKTGIAEIISNENDMISFKITDAHNESVDWCVDWQSELSENFFKDTIQFFILSKKNKYEYINE